jgi:hypothetical protein
MRLFFNLPRISISPPRDSPYRRSREVLLGLAELLPQLAQCDACDLLLHPPIAGGELGRAQLALLDTRGDASNVARPGSADASSVVSSLSV